MVKRMIKTGLSVILLLGVLFFSGLVTSEVKADANMAPAGDTWYFDKYSADITGYNYPYSSNWTYKGFTPTGSVWGYADFPWKLDPSTGLWDFSNSGAGYGYFNVLWQGEDFYTQRKDADGTSVVIKQVIANYGGTWGVDTYESYAYRTTLYKQGSTLLQSNIIANVDQYPEAGAKDGFWWVRKNRYGPQITVDQDGDFRLSKLSSEKSFTLTGVATDSEGRDVTVRAMVGQVSKSAVVKSGQSYSLTFNYSDYTVPSTNAMFVMTAAAGGKARTYYYNGTGEISNKDVYVWSKFEKVDKASYTLVTSPTTRLGYLNTYPNPEPGFNSYSFSADKGLIFDSPFKKYYPVYIESSSNVNGYPKNFAKYDTEMYNGSMYANTTSYRVNETLTPMKGNLLNYSVEGLEGDYPDDGPKGAFWWVKQGNKTSGLILYPDTDKDSRISVLSSESSYTYGGTVTSGVGTPVTIQGTLGSVTKTAVVNSGDRWQLTWSNSEFSQDLAPSSITIKAIKGSTITQVVTGHKVSVDKHRAFMWKKYSANYTGTGQWNQQGSSTFVQSYTDYVSGYSGFVLDETGMNISGAKYKMSDLSGPVFREYSKTSNTLVIQQFSRTYNVNNGVPYNERTEETRLTYSWDPKVWTKGYDLNQRVVALENEYPNPEGQKDGYWWVPVGYYEPSVNITTSTGARISKLSTEKSWSLKGTASDPDGGNVTVSATLGGVTKTQTVPSGGSWTLTWNVTDFSSSVPTSMLKVLASSTVGTSSKNFAGQVSVNLNDLGAWDKYSYGEVQGFDLGGWSQSSSGNWNSYPIESYPSVGYSGYTIDPKTGVPQVTGQVVDADQVIRNTQTSGSGMFAVKSYFVKNGRLYEIHRWGGYDYSGFRNDYILNQANITRMIPTGVMGKVNLLTTNIIGVSGDYPNPEGLQGGFWWVYKGKYGPHLTFSNPQDARLSNLPSEKSLIISGVATDDAGATVTVKGTLGGVTKTQTVNSGSTWTLTWNVSEYSADVAKTYPTFVGTSATGQNSSVYPNLVSVDLRPMHVWEKYQLVMTGTGLYTTGSPGYNDRRDSRDIIKGWTGYDFDPAKGFDTSKYVYKETENEATLYDIQKNGNYVSVKKQNQYSYRDWSTDGEMHWRNDISFVNYVYDPIVQSKGALLSKKVLGFEGDYPNPEGPQGGFWWVYKGLYGPHIQFSSSGALSMNKMPGKSTIGIGGVATDDENADVTITATIGGVTKTKVVPSGGAFNLSWSISEFTSGLSVPSVSVLATSTTGKRTEVYNYPVTINSRDIYLWDKYNAWPYTAGYKEEVTQIQTGFCSNWNGYQPTSSGIWFDNDGVAHLSGWSNNVCANPNNTGWWGYYQLDYPATTTYKVFVEWDPYANQDRYTLYKVIGVPNTQYMKGTDLLQKDVMGFDGQYPTPEGYQDGYWWVRTKQFGPVLTFYNTDSPTIVKYPATSKTWTLSGKATNWSGKPITVTATLGDITKTVQTSSNSNWSMTWSVDEFDKNWNLSELIVTASDADITNKFKYKYTIIVDKSEFEMWDKYQYIPKMYWYNGNVFVTGTGLQKGDKAGYKEILWDDVNKRFFGQGQCYFNNDGDTCYELVSDSFGRAPGQQYAEKHMYGSQASGQQQAGYYYYMYDVQVNANSQWLGTGFNTPVPEKGVLLQKNFVAKEGSYPKPEGPKDYYYWVYKGKYVEAPELNLNSQQKIYVSEVPGRQVFSITGTVENTIDSSVTVKATVAGVTKSTVVTESSMGNPKNFKLEWNVKTDAIPETEYHGIEVTASNDVGEVTKTSDLIVVVDKTAPKINPVGIVSNNPNPKFAKQGDQVTLSFKTSEQVIDLPVAKLNSRTLSVVKAQMNSFSGVTVMGPSDGEGPLVPNIEVEDLAGNKSTANATTDGGEITYYSKASIIDPVTMDSSNSNPKYAKVGDTITVKFTLDHKMKNTPLVKIGTEYVDVVDLGNNSYKAEKVMTAADTEGQIPFMVSNLEDAAGNGGLTVADVSEGGRVVFDKTSPELSTISLSERGGRSVISMVSTEQLSAEPQVKILGDEATVAKISPVMWEASIDLQSKTPGTNVVFEINGYKDMAGNPGNKRTDTTDGTALVIGGSETAVGSVSIKSSGANSSLAQVGDKITVTVISDRPLGDSYVGTIAGETAMSHESGNTYSFDVTVGRSQRAGQVVFKIEGLDTTDGNSITRTTDGSFVTIVNDTPSLEKVTITSSNKDPGYAVVGDVIDVKIESNKELAEYPKVYVGKGQAQISGESGNSYEFSYTLTADEDEGRVPIRVSDIKDFSGTAGTPVTNTTDGSFVVFDKTPPIIKSVMLVGTDKVRFEFSEELGEVPEISIEGEKVPLSTTDNISFEATLPAGGKSYVISGAEDKGGNKLPDFAGSISAGTSTGTESGKIVMILLQGVTANEVRTGPVTPVYSASSSESSNVTTSSTLDGKAWASGKPVKTVGVHTLVINAADAVGNTETLTISFEIK